MRIPASDSGNQIIRTADAAYSAFVYNYAHREETEYFCILKTPDGGETSLLWTGSFNSVQDRNLTMSLSDDGIIRVLPPTGNTAVFIDTATDEVTEHTYTIFYPTYEELKPQVNEVVTDSRTGEDYYLTVSRSRYFGMNVRKIDSEKQSVPAKGRILDFDRDLAGGYTGIYTFGADGGRVFIVGTREISQEQTGGKLTYSGRTQSVKDSLMLFVIDDVAESETVRCIEIEAPYEDEGSGGIWSCVKTDDAFLDADGKLNVIYTVWRCDFDDADRRENDGVVADSLRVFRAVFDGDSQISKEELRIDGADRETSLRMIRTSDGTEYIAACNLQNSYPFLRFGIYPEGGEAKVTVYCSTDYGWKPAAEKTLGKYAAEGFALSGPRSGSADSDTVNCIVFTSENDVRILSLAFSEK